MAKVRVEVTGADASADMQVGVWGVVQFQINEEGKIANFTGKKDYIIACRDSESKDVVAFEVLWPAPYSITEPNFIRIVTGGKTYYFSQAIEYELLQEGRAYTYRVVLPTANEAAARHLAIRTASVATSSIR